jgi:hypothetical protein
LRIDFLISQGWLKNANPGLEDEIPSGFILRLNSARCGGDFNYIVTIETISRDVGNLRARTFEAKPDTSNIFV